MRFTSARTQHSPQHFIRVYQHRERSLNGKTIALSFSLLLAVAFVPMAMAQSLSQAITEQEAPARATDAYISFDSLVTRDVTRRQCTNVKPGKELGKGSMNLVNNVREYPPADFKGKGAFNLTMRLYAPRAEVLTGKWSPPPLTRVQGLPSLVAQ